MSQNLRDCCVHALPTPPVSIQTGYGQTKLDEVQLKLAGARPTAPVKDAVASFLLALDDSSLETIIERLQRERPRLTVWQFGNGSPWMVQEKPAIQKPVQQVPQYARPEVTDFCMQFPATDRSSAIVEFKGMASYEPDFSTLKHPPLPTAQFSAPIFFANEEAGFVEVEVMLVGPLATVNGAVKNAAVCWTTEDGSAKAGHKFIAAAGKVVFGPSSTFEKIRIDLINNDDWSPTLDFQVVLTDEGAENCQIHRYHMRSRVKIIDDDAFPSNRFQDLLLQDKVEDVPVLQLVLDYIRINMKNDLVRKGTYKAMAADFLANCQFLLCLILKVWLINDILVPTLDGNDVTSGRPGLLTCVAILFLVPDFFLHYLDYRRNFWKLGGAPRKLLQANLMRKFMCYCDAVRNNVDHGEIILVLFKEIPEVVANVYGAIFPLVRDVTLLVFLFLYQVVGTRLMGLKTAEDRWVILNCAILVVFPLLAFVALKLRYRGLYNSMLKAKHGERACTENTIDMLNNYYLLADYLNRGKAVAKFEQHIDAFNKALTAHNAFETNDSFVPRALSLVLCSGWVLYGGLLIINSDGAAETGLSLGTYIAQWEIIAQIGISWQNIYEHLTRIADSVTELQNIVRFMNFKVENHDEKEFMNSCTAKGLEFAATLAKAPQSSKDDVLVDKLPIKMGNFSHEFDERRVINSVNLEMQQGMLHLIAGRRDTGKTTLLSIIGGRTLMQHCKDQGFFFIPQHLRVLHISKEPLFFKGTLLENLTYGVHHGDKDGRLERVLNICRGLGVLPEALELISEDKKARVCCWNEELSRSDRQLLNLARGLVANPEVLCVHKPSMGLGPHTVPTVLGALKTFVAQRGMYQDVDRYYFRRPRTCIYTLASPTDMKFAHEVHHPLDGKLPPTMGADE